MVEHGDDRNVDTTQTKFGFWLSFTVLMHSYILVGIDGWCPMQIVHDYMDLVEQNLWHPDSKGLQHVRQVELDHRTKWCDLMRSAQNINLGEAIKQTMVELRGSWQTSTFRLKDAMEQSTSSRGPPGLSGPPAKRQRTMQHSMQQQGTKQLQLIDYKNGKEICHLWNRGKCGRECSYQRLHECDVKGCGKAHRRIDNHKQL